MLTHVSVAVPATTANLGPGFDCLGAALQLHNQFQFTRQPVGTPLHITVTGPDAARVQTDAHNLVYQAFARFHAERGETPPAIALHINMTVPLARGLGSSATAIVGGLVGANALAGSPLSQTELLALAIAIEGHPDNVVPALLGGCQLAASSGDTWQICDLAWHPDVVPIVAIPDFELSTQAARQVLPAHYSRADAIFNIAHLGLLLRGLATGHPDWLREALRDRIHQPYRQQLIPGYAAVQDAALAAGAYGLVISGAGPTLLALTNPAQVSGVAAAIQTAWTHAGIQAMVKTASIDEKGAIAQIA